MHVVYQHSALGDAKHVVSCAKGNDIDDSRRNIEAEEESEKEEEGTRRTPLGATSIHEALCISSINSAEDHLITLPESVVKKGNILSVNGILLASTTAVFSIPKKIISMIMIIIKLILGILVVL